MRECGRERERERERDIKWYNLPCMSKMLKEYNSSCKSVLGCVRQAKNPSFQCNSDIF